MTLPKERQASKRIERQQLIQDIKQQNPDITDEQLSRYDIDDLRKIKLATAPKAQTEKLSQVEKYNRKFGTDKLNPNEIPEEVSRIRGMQYGGKMKKGYRAIGEVKRQEKVETIKARIERLAQQLAELETAGGGRKMSEQDINYAKARLESAERSPEAKQRLDEYMQRMRSPHKGMQYGGMADMSAAPMIKQPQRKKRKTSGFRTKYSKGGGVRKSKYSL